MKIVTIVGSIRKESLNMQLALTIQERYKDQFEMDILDIKALPFYDQDEENDPPQSVLEFKKRVADADAVLIITPEYNWSISGVLKNAIDWLSRVDKVMAGKPVTLAGVAGGPMGTIRAQLHLRQILTGLQVNMMPPAGNEVSIGFANQKFASGRLSDEPTLTFLDGVVNKFVDFVHSSK
ncbi:NADPH-dependent FMN reductase [Paenisporosarcina indica]|uniref:NADPH-dependent FMN reductase n=1 Tax=Paenisporosarcina indica TaxID=650093 RepID=UPI00094F7EB5|nr:NADPH-dependent FMN reductase [Paenisporosarcina indica]